MFEKSLYDLIRGLRHHKGNEKEYIQNCLKECRSEIQSQDMDLKATALLKVIYLEMLGYDMSWASFRVLEVMSSPKYHQKRVGYLGAVQSFQPDTEVLMLATNLLKKDLASTSTPIITLPIAALPHITTPSLALSCLSDLLPRLSHTNPSIRKKTIVTLYRLCLVYPEALRAAWPRIKDRLSDPAEDPIVTSAIINVVCELGWRRPHDFLPLAPRLFSLLVESNNNWMAIKLIKLFATLTPLEPRLVRKLLPPLTNLIRTTHAMSLLYECINGIIQGGILGSSDDVSGREEIASLCVDKLRSMIMVDGDPNLKYVALLAFNKIVITHPALVAEQEDVILECIDSSDITIRVKSLDLVQGMVSSENLVSIVSRLMRQLKGSSNSDQRQAGADGDEDSSDYDEKGPARRDAESPPLPEDYKIDVIGRILTMCSQNNYASLLDFDWYIDILTQLVRTAPPPRVFNIESNVQASRPVATDVSERIGNELRNVAVKVRAVRLSAVSAAGTIIARINADSPLSHPIIYGALKPVAWLVGEYAGQLPSPEDIMNLLLQLIPRAASPEVLATCLQAVVKILARVAGDDLVYWNAERKSKISLMLARIIHVFEPFVSNPNLEVQERAVGFVELLKLTAEAVSAQPASTDDVQQDTPLLLTQAIPSLFAGWELNSVAAGAQHNVPVLEELDLDEPIHPNLSGLLSQADHLDFEASEADEFDVYYHHRSEPTSISSQPAANRLVSVPAEELTSSYQQEATEDSYLDADIIARRKAERAERNRDDPFYIGNSGPGTPARTSTPIHNILQTTNGPDLDIDSIPVMQLDLGQLSSSAPSPSTLPEQRKSKKTKPIAIPQRVAVAADETLGSSLASTPKSEMYASDGQVRSKTKSQVNRGLLGVDSRQIGTLSLEGEGKFEEQQKEDAEMVKAIKEVERLRLEMQRARERVAVADGVTTQVVTSKKGKKKKNLAPIVDLGTGDNDVVAAAATTKPKKKKKAKETVEPIVADPGPSADVDANVVSRPKKKKKKPARMAEIVD